MRAYWKRTFTALSMLTLLGTASLAAEVKTIAILAP